MLEKHKRLSKNARLAKKQMKAKANARNYQLKRDKICKKSNEYYRKKKAELSEANELLELKRKKALYNSEYYKSKRDEINNRSKELYREKKAESDRATFKDFGKRMYCPPPRTSHYSNCPCEECIQKRKLQYLKENPKPIYYEKAMSIDCDPSQLKNANAPSIVIRDPSQLKAPDLPSNMIEICVDFNSWNKDRWNKVKKGSSMGCLEMVLLEIANIVRNSLRSTFTDPIECEYILMRLFDKDQTLKPEADRTDPNLNADCNQIYTEYGKEWFKSLGIGSKASGFGSEEYHDLCGHIFARLEHVYGIGGCKQRGYREIVLEHAAKLDLLNSEVSANLQNLLLNEVKSLQEYFYSCIISDDVNIKKIGFSILLFSFLTNNKANILYCGFREIHYQRVLEESRQMLQSLGISSWRLGKHIIEHRNFWLHVGSSQSLVPEVIKMYDWRTGDYYYDILSFSECWKGIKSKLRGSYHIQGKMIEYRDNVFTLTEHS